jgi:hypothetical protein
VSVLCVVYPALDVVSTFRDSGKGQESEPPEELAFFPASRQAEEASTQRRQVDSRHPIQLADSDSTVSGDWLAPFADTCHPTTQMGTPSAGSTTDAVVEASSSSKAHNDNTDSKTVTAQDLVDAFKNNGSFDAVRNEILKSFTASVR